MAKKKISRETEIKTDVVGADQDDGTGTENLRPNSGTVTVLGSHTFVRDGKGELVSISGPDEEGFGLLMQYYAER